MAGIGFTLRQVLRGRTLLSTVRAYGAGALVSSGPWAVSILSLALIGSVCGGEIGRPHVHLFFAIVTHVFCYSLILTGPLQLVVTRYIADTVFLRRHLEIIPSLFGALLLTLVGLHLVGLPCVLSLRLPPVQAIGILTLFAVVGSIWVTMLFISAMRRYARIFVAFFIGSTVSVAAAWIGSRHLGMAGLLWGYVAGQSVLLYALITVIALEFPRGEGVSFDFLRYFRLHPRLAWTGLCVNLAIWIDKILFWHHPDTGVQVVGFLHTAPLYDLPAFLAYLSIIPGMAVFTVRVETDLADAYERYFDRVLHRGALDEIRTVKREMASILGDGARRLFYLQGLVALTLVLVAPQLVAWLGIQWVHLPVLRLHLVAVVPQVLMLVAITALYFFDAQRSALLMTATFLVANAAMTAQTLALGPTWYGTGLAGAATLTAATGLVLVNRVMRDLEYVTFTSQPMVAKATATDNEDGAGTGGETPAADATRAPGPTRPTGTAPSGDRAA